MQKTIYDFRNYKKYLKSRLELRAKKERGVRSRLAEKLNCQPAFISQVMNGNSDFSLEQASLINLFFDHSKQESHFFYLLIQLARAGNAPLKEYFQDELEKHVQANFDLAKRIKPENKISIEHQNKYYSSWSYSAVHISTYIPRLRTANAMTEYLNLPKSHVLQCLEDLQAMQLVHKENENYFPEEGDIHLNKDSPLILQLHTNWRIKALQSINYNQENRFHYSTVIGIKKKDQNRIKEIQTKALEAIRQVMVENMENKQEPEALYCYNYDFFELSELD